MNYLVSMVTEVPLIPDNVLHLQIVSVFQFEL